MDAAAVEAPRRPLALPEADVERVRIARIHARLDRARPSVVRQVAGQLRPRLAAVDRLEESAVADLAPDVPRGRDVDDVRIGRVHDDGSDRVGVLQPHVGEGLSAVGRLVDAVAPRRGVASALFAGADPDDVGILLEDRDVADRRRAVVVEDRRPGDAGVGRLEHAAGGAADDDVGEVVLERIDCGDASDQVRVPDVAPLERLNQGILRVRCRRLWLITGRALRHQRPRHRERADRQQDPQGPKPRHHPPSSVRDGADYSRGMHGETQRRQATDYTDEHGNGEQRTRLAHAREDN